MVRKDSELKFRVETDLAEAVKAKAERLHVPLSLILRQLLRAWVRKEDLEAERELLEH